MFNNVRLGKCKKNDFWTDFFSNHISHAHLADFFQLTHHFIFDFVNLTSRTIVTKTDKSAKLIEYLTFKNDVLRNSVPEKADR